MPHARPLGILSCLDPVAGVAIPLWGFTMGSRGGQPWSIGAAGFQGPESSNGIDCASMRVLLGSFFSCDESNEMIVTTTFGATWDRRKARKGPLDITRYLQLF
ncbi:hypothetical protein F5Y17DRAFT_184534 [Xylariaceae sp. FL0594]|nr:hypothetical protein F5Y17DRAFT_184534 [Xylariaceae sp. FL0594]